ncbi:hypothetical protein XENTR_v10003350 [Xenopus tropicalis]|nr:hypothetical protein XENTR_v10003350 [Xenopus tropicalis]
MILSYCLLIQVMPTPTPLAPQGNPRTPDPQNFNLHTLRTHPNPQNLNPQNIAIVELPPNLGLHLPSPYTSAACSLIPVGGHFPSPIHTRSLTGCPDLLVSGTHTLLLGGLRVQQPPYVSCNIGLCLGHCLFHISLVRCSTHPVDPLSTWLCCVTVGWARAPHMQCRQGGFTAFLEAGQGYICAAQIIPFPVAPVCVGGIIIYHLGFPKGRDTWFSPERPSVYCVEQPIWKYVVLCITMWVLRASPGAYDPHCAHTC